MSNFNFFVYWFAASLVVYALFRLLNYFELKCSDIGKESFFDKLDDDHWLWRYFLFPFIFILAVIGIPSIFLLGGIESLCSKREYARSKELAELAYKISLCDHGTNYFRSYTINSDCSNPIHYDDWRSASLSKYGITNLFDDCSHLQENKDRNTYAYMGCGKGDELDIQAEKDSSAAYERLNAYMKTQHK